MKREQYKQASRQHKAEDTVLDLDGIKIGGGHFQLIAGPCAVESRKQLHDTVAAIVSCGIRLIRGGAYKPRTSPYDFQGLGAEALDMLGELKKKHGVKIVTEAVSPGHVDEIAAVADILQVGSRNALNYELLKVVGAAGKPVVLKRGMGSTVEEWLSAAEHLIVSGCSDVILCERGIKTFETATRNTLDIGGMALARQETHLPIIVDPSHAAGTKDLVMPLALAAVAAGADGLLMEVHCSPEDALCDGPQQIPTGELAEAVDKITTFARTAGKTVA